MKNVIAVDAATALLSICLMTDDRYYEITLDCGLKHMENILVQMDHLFKTAGITAKDLELLVCSEGPGSFTGLRIAMSTIKGMGAALDIPYTAVPTLDYLAGGLDFFPGAVVPVIDAKKKRFYCAVYEQGKKVIKDGDIPADVLLETLKKYKNVLLCGPDCLMINDETRSGLFHDGNYKSGKSRQLLEMGIEKFKISGADPISSGPVYIRKSEAEIAMFGE